MQPSAGKWVRLGLALAALFFVSLGGRTFAQDDRWEQALEAGEQALGAGDFERAETQLQAALNQALNFEHGDPRRARTLVGMARLYRAQGDFAKPEGYYRDALKAAEAAHGPGDTEYARYLHEVGGYYHTRRKYDLAEEYYKKAFALRVKNLGREHIEVAESINRLGVLYENQARLDKADVYYETALAIREKLLGPEHLQTITTAEHYARLLSKLQRPAESQELLSRARAIREARVERINTENLDSGEIYPLAEVRRPPKLQDRVEPDYTDEARIARHEGTVILQITIDSEGRPTSFRLLRSLGLGLDEKAAEAVRQWKFRPARHEGKRVAVVANIEIEFSLM